MTLTFEQSNFLVVPLVYLIIIFWLARRLFWGAANSHLFQTSWARAWATFMATVGVLLFFAALTGGLDAQTHNPALVALAVSWNIDPANLLITLFILVAAAGIIDGMALAGLGQEQEPKPRRRPWFGQRSAPQ